MRTSTDARTLVIAGHTVHRFKLTCAVYGYTVVVKGTTSELWKEVAREAQVYRILRKAQASAVPDFLGTIDLAKIYFLHRAGQIRHMPIIGWGGQSTAIMESNPSLYRRFAGDSQVE